MVGSIMPVSEDICLTATVDVSSPIMKGSGPRRELMMLGYSGWQPGSWKVKSSRTAR